MSIFYSVEKEEKEIIKRFIEAIIRRGDGVKIQENLFEISDCTLNFDCLKCIEIN